MAKPGEMHPVDEAFHKHTVAQRNAAWAESARYKDRIDRAIEVLDNAFGHADAPYTPAALEALHILRGLS